MGPAAVSGGQQEHHERAPSPSSEEPSPQDPSYQSAEEEPGTPDRVGCGGSGRSRTTVALTALSNHLSEDEVGLSDSSLTVQDVSTDHLSDLYHVQQTLEEDSCRAEDESDESPETVEAADTECITAEENADVSISSAAAAAGSAEEQEDIQSSQETELSDETDVCVHQGI